MAAGHSRFKQRRGRTVQRRTFSRQEPFSAAGRLLTVLSCFPLLPGRRCHGRSGRRRTILQREGFLLFCAYKRLPYRWYAQDRRSQSGTLRFGERKGDDASIEIASGRSPEYQPHSVRNACIGSMRDALHAGTRQASVATASNVAATAAKIAGSRGWVP